MRCYFETIELLAKEPERWLAQKSIVHVKVFLDGFANAEVLGGDIESLVPLINGFGQFLAKKYEDSWRSLYKHGYDDSDAFDIYFNEWKSFYSQWQQSSAMSQKVKRQAQVVDISKTLSHIRSHPHVYFVYPSIGFLFSYLKGTQRSCECYTTGVNIAPDIQKFESWLCRKFALNKACRWDRLLLVENGFNEYAAFQNFFERLDEFTRSA